MPDHVHVMMSIPPKFAVARIIGFIKGKNAIQTAKIFSCNLRHDSKLRIVCFSGRPMENFAIMAIFCNFFIVTYDNIGKGYKHKHSKRR